VANWGERNLVLEKSPSQKILKSKGVNGLEIEEDAQGVMQKVSHNCWGNSPLVGCLFMTPMLAPTPQVLA
jgi:hypothetical protein